MNLTENMYAPDAAKKLILPNVVLKLQGAQGLHHKRL